jgi:hypothetical protein
MAPTGEAIRRALLEAIARRTDSGLQSESVLRAAAQQLDLRNDLASEQALLTFLNDLFRLGYLSWGYNITNPNPPFCHLTELGRRALSAISRDPANPDGYMAHLKTKGPLDPIAESYISEGLHTYNSGCFKATAVMTGAAAEAMALRLRDALLARFSALTKAPPADLQDWRMKRVLSSMQQVFELHEKSMPKPLAEAVASYWPAFTQQIRVARNEAGHPAATDPVSPETAHASLLIFPELATLATQLAAWVSAAAL